MGDIRRALRRADDPETGQYCPGLEACTFRQQGDDPCAGCKARDDQNRKPEFFTTVYAFFLHSFIETTRPGPGELSWLDLEIHQAFLAARTGYERERLSKKGEI